MTNEELESKRTPCEIFTRVVGYYRPVDNFNDSKQEEYKDRVEFEIPEEVKC